MIYRITIDLAFENEAPIKAIKNTALDHFPKAVTINPGGEQEERGYIKLLHCYHDEHWCYYETDLNWWIVRLWTRRN